MRELVVCGVCGVCVHHDCLTGYERMNAELAMCKAQVFRCGKCQTSVCLCEMCGMKGRYDSEVWMKCENECGTYYHYACLSDKENIMITKLHSAAKQWYCNRCHDDYSHR